MNQTGDVRGYAVTINPGALWIGHGTDRWRWI